MYVLGTLQVQRAIAFSSTPVAGMRKKDFLQILEPWKRAMIFRAIGDLFLPPEANVHTDTHTYTPTN